MNKYEVEIFYAGLIGYVIYENGKEVYRGYSVDEIINRFGIHPNDMEARRHGKA